MWTNGHFRRTFGFSRKQSYYIRCTFGFGVLQLVNSVVAESRVQSLSCGGRERPRRSKSLASLTDYVKITEKAALTTYASGTAGHDRVALMTLSTFGFGFRPKVPFYFRWHMRFRPNVLRHFRPTFRFGRK